MGQTVKYNDLIFHDANGRQVSLFPTRRDGKSTCSWPDETVSVVFLDGAQGSGGRARTGRGRSRSRGQGEAGIGQ